VQPLSLAQSLLPKIADFGRFIGKERVIFFNETLQGSYYMYLSELGYSELVQRLFEKMTFFLPDHRCFVCCRPGGRRGDTKRVVTQWQRPVASSVALDMMHWAMPHILLQRLCIVIKMSSNIGAFVHRRRLFCFP